MLLCPAWKRWGSAKAATLGTIILHPRGGEVILFEDSAGLKSVSGLPKTSLTEVGTTHRLADPEPVAALVRAVEAQ